MRASKLDGPGHRCPASRRRLPSSAGRATLSISRNVGSRLANWKTKPILRLRKAASAFSDRPQISVPSTMTVPPDGRLKPPIIAISEDLPEPDRPMIAAKRPGSTSRSMPATAVTSPRSVR